MSERRKRSNKRLFRFTDATLFRMNLMADVTEKSTGSVIEQAIDYMYRKFHDRMSIISH